MSAETLRKAAALMRQRAEAATPGPWVRSGSSIEVDHECSPSHDCWPVCDSYSGMKPDGSTYPRDLIRANAEHIASWHPTVALAVANLLDDAAQNADLLADGGELGPQHDTIMRRIAHSHALTVARAYLGRDA